MNNKRRLNPKKPSPAAEEVTRRNVEAILRSEWEAEQRLTRSDVMAKRLVAFCGSGRFIAVHVVWFGTWILLNSILPTAGRWDPPPFPALTLVVSLEAIFLSCLILISQNREAAVTDRRAHLDLQINMLAEQENTKLLQLLQKVATKVGVNTNGDCEARALREDTEIACVISQIEECAQNGAVRRNPRRRPIKPE